MGKETQQNPRKTTGKPLKKRNKQGNEQRGTEERTKKNKKKKKREKVRKGTRKRGLRGVVVPAETAPKIDFLFTSAQRNRNEIEAQKIDFEHPRKRTRNTARKTKKNKEKRRTTVENKENKAIQRKLSKTRKKRKKKEKKNKGKRKKKKNNENKEQQRKTESETGQKGFPFSMHTQTRYTRMCSVSSGHSLHRLLRTGVGRLARLLGRFRSPGILATLEAFSSGFWVWGFRV